MSDLFIQEPSRDWSDPDLASRPLRCPACALDVDADHDTEACIQEWGRKLAALVAEMVEKEKAR